MMIRIIFSAHIMQRERQKLCFLQHEGKHILILNLGK